MPPAIQLEGLTKRFGPERGVFDVSFAVEPGEVFGFLGPNGAGKTTVIRLMLGYMRPETGSVRLLGYDAQKQAVAIRQRLGYVPAEFTLALEGSARRWLKYLAGYRQPGCFARAELLADRLELPLDARVKTFSRGMKQKLALIQAMMHEPDLLVLDEPTEALDPLVQHTVHGLVREAAAAGRTVFFSSHQLAEVDALCDRVAIIGRGKLLANETIADLRTRRRRVLRLQLSESLDAAALGLPGTAFVRQDGPWAVFHLAGSARPLLAALAHLPVADFTLEPAPLEESFLEYYA